jgi:hypothetical protein
MPWTCEEGSVTLAWRAQLIPGTNYYWNDIPIPPELIRNGKLYGRASLTAILRPLVSPLAGANYFSSRLQTSLQYPSGDNWLSLAGSMLESTLSEQDARDELKKWQPVRRHYRDFTGRGGINFDGTRLRLYARVFHPRSLSIRLEPPQPGGRARRCVCTDVLERKRDRDDL